MQSQSCNHLLAVVQGWDMPPREDKSRKQLYEFLPLSYPAILRKYGHEV